MSWSDSHLSWGGRRIHMIGIGGAGMSGYARVCRQLGATVSGSDALESPKLDALRDHGIEIFVGHAAKNVPKDADVFYSSAIAPSNPERKAAGKRGQPTAPILAACSSAERSRTPQRHEQQRGHAGADRRAAGAAQRSRRRSL